MVRTEVTSRSGDPDAGFDWIIAVKSKTFDQLADVEGRALLDQELASALTRAQTGELGRRIANMEEKLMHDGKRLRGRQMLHMVYEYYNMDEGAGAMYDVEDLFAVELKGDNLEGFLNTYDHTLAGLVEDPGEKMRKPILLKQLRKSNHLKMELAAYELLPPEEKTHEWLYGALSALGQQKETQGEQRSAT